MRQVALILIAAAFTYLVAWAGGRLLLARLRVRLFRCEEHFFGFLAGAALLSTLVFLVTCLRLAHRGVFLGLGLGLILLSWRAGALRSRAERMAPLAWGWRIAFGGIYGVYAFLYLVNALAPEASPDGTIYHVALPAQYLREHGFSWTTRNLLANLSEGVEMLFLFGYAFGRHSAAAMVHLLFTLTTPLGMLGYARRIGMPVAGVAGALLFFASPIVGKDGVSAYVDVAAAAAAFGAFYALEIWRGSRETGLLGLAGLLGGFAYAAKYTAGLAVVYVLGCAVYSLWRSKQPVWRAALVISLCAAAVMLPWMLKNVYVAGNPFSPAGNKLFPNPVLSVSSEMACAYAMRTMSGIEPKWREIPLELTVRGELLQGTLGPVFLLAPLMLVALRRAAGRRLVLAAAILAAFYPTSIATRFLVPALPFLSLALGVALSMWKPAAAAALALHAVLSWPAVLGLYTRPSAWRIAGIPWREALRLEAEQDFLAKWVPGYRMGLLLEEVVPPGEPVLAFNSFPQSYYRREVFAGWQSSFGVRLAEGLQTAYTDNMTPTWHREFRFPGRALRRLRLVQTARSDTDNWSVSELRFFHRGIEVARGPGWRLKARPNPWDVQLAFDNNPVTRWTSGEPHRPGMYIEIDFGSDTAVDAVRAECSHDQWRSKMRLEVERGPGQWHRLETESTGEDAAAPGYLRHAAVEYLRQNSIRWLLVEDSVEGAPDFRNRESEWGLALAAQRGSFRLYRVR